METSAAESPDEGETTAGAKRLWRIDVAAHRLYMEQELQQGVRLLSLVREMSDSFAVASGSPAADAFPVPFMEAQQHQQSLLSGAYWILCCLALLRPEPPTAEDSSSSSSSQGVQQHRAANLLPLPLELKEMLVKNVFLRCLCRQRFLNPPLACVDDVRVTTAAISAPAATTAAGASVNVVAGTRVASQKEKILRTAPAVPGMEVTVGVRHRDGDVVGFSTNPARDALPAAIPTCSGLQGLALLDSLPLLSEVTLQQLRRFLLQLQRREDGAFANTLTPWCCGTCFNPAVDAAVVAPGWVCEQEGDVRCTFSCLLGLKLIHTAATALRRSTSSSAALVTAVAAAGSAGQPASADLSVTTATVSPATTKPRTSLAPCLSASTSHIGEEKCAYDDSWEAFMQDPFAGVRVEATVDWLLSLLTLDGGVGVSPGAEAHAGAAFCFAGSLALLGKCDALGANEKRRVERWLKERQLVGGALQGRPGKDGDSCYAFWVTAALLLLEKRPLKLVKPAALVDAVAAAQHPSGGISRTAIPAKPNAASRCKGAGPRGNEKSCVPPGDGESDSGINTPLWFLSGGVLNSAKKQQSRPDPFHTFFALAGLSLLAHSSDTDELQQGGEGQQQHEWQATCRRLLRPIDPQTALPRGLI